MYKVKLSFNLLIEQEETILSNIKQKIISQLDRKVDINKKINSSNMMRNGKIYEYPIFITKYIDNKKFRFFNKKQSISYENKLCGYIYQIIDNSIYIKIRNFSDVNDIIHYIQDEFNLINVELTLDEVSSRIEYVKKI